MELSDDVPIAHVDSGQVQQLLINLIYNAAEALADRPEDRKIWVSTSGGSGGGRDVQITVRDNGPGVARDKEALLFNDPLHHQTSRPWYRPDHLPKIADNHSGSIAYDYDTARCSRVYCR